MSKFKKLLSVMVLAVVAVSCFVAHGISFASASTTSTLSDNLVYQLDFADSTNRMDNKAGNSIADATLTTDGTNATFTENAFKGMTALNLNKAGARLNYVTVPGEVVNYDSVTIAGWVKQANNIGQWTRPFSIITDNSNRMEIMPWAQQGLLNVSLVAGGQKLTYKGEDSLTVSSTRKDNSTNYYSSKGNLTSVYGDWAHYAYEFTPTDFNYYVNGELYFTVNVSELKNAGPNNSLSLKQIYDASKNTRFVIGATLVHEFDSTDNTADYTGSFADFRIYNKALSSTELKEIAGFNDYNDYLIASYDFNDTATPTKDSVRGLNGTLVNTAKVENGVLVLDGAGVGVNASQLTIPSNAVAGYQKLTISADILVKSDVANYGRFFEITPSWKEQLLLAFRWNHGGDLYVNKMVAKFGMINNDNDVDTTYSPINFNMYGRWINITVTVDDKNICVYADGFLLKSSPINYNPQIFNYKGTNATIVSFGGSPKSTSDKGAAYSMDNVKVYATALTTDEVISIYEENRNDVTELWYDANLADVSLENGGYLEGLAETNIDYMMSLNADRLLYNHRKKAGLDTKGAESYGGWEAPNQGLSGQFASNYLAALARASANFPNYEYNGETVLERLTYMVTEFKKCQDAYAVLYPEDAGYFGGLHMDHFTWLVTRNGSGWYGWNHQFTVTLPDGTTQGTKIWVPWRVYHDNLKALYDVAIYAGTPELRAIGRQMMYSAADWVYNELNSYDTAQRERVDNLEYGGMGEALWNISYLAQQDGLYEKSGQYAFAAHYFEEENLTTDWYNNIDNFSDKHDKYNNLDGKHANTAIPKMFALVAAYEVTGNEYYLTGAKNTFDLIVGENPDLSAGLLYAFGGQSRYENWQDPQGELETDPHTAETCCTLNMLKFADYLFRWTGDVKYAEFYELAFTNHTLASMDPTTAGKTYFVNTDFGGHKIYHDKESHFWCCTATGLESFAKLQYGIYYKNTAGDISVNTFYPSTYKVSNDLTLVQSGNFYETQNTKITISGSGDFALRLRVPAWAKDGYTIKINGTEQNLTAQNGYLVIDRVWNDGDYVDYNVPFSVWFKTLNTTTNKKAMMYGPLTMVCKMAAISESECIKYYTNYPHADAGSVLPEIQHMGAFSNAVSISSDETENYPIITVSTYNQGDLTFIPFNRIFRYRYGMYFNYREIPEVTGSDVSYTFDIPTDNGGNADYDVENGKLVNNKDNAFITLLSNNPSTYIFTYTLHVEDYMVAFNTGAIINGVGANGYYMSVEKSSGVTTSVFNVYPITDGVLGTAVLTQNLQNNRSNKISVKIIASGADLFIMVTADFTTEHVYTMDSATANPSISLYTISGDAKYDEVVVRSSTTSSKTVLDYAIAYGDALVTTGYTTSSVAIFNTALANAKTVANEVGSTETDLATANATLRTAINGLTAIADTSAFDEIVLEVAELDETAYTASSWKAVQDKIAEIAGLDISDMAQPEYDALVESLSALIDNLAPIGDKTALNNKIAEVEAIDQNLYTSKTWNDLQTALANAKAVANNAQASQAQCNAQVTALTNAVNALVLRGDKTALNAKIAEAEALNENDYTVNSWADLQTKLESAKNLGDDVTQAEIDFALNRLKSSINGLVRKSNTPGGDNTGDSGNTDNAGGGMNCSMSLGAETFVIGFMALAVGLFLVVKKIKRHDA